LKITVVVDDHALESVPGLDADLARAGALVMRSFRNTPNPQLLRRHAGVGVVGGPDRAGLLARLERATATLASVPAPVIGILPPGVAPSRELQGPGVVDLVPASAPRVADRILVMARVPVVTAGRARLEPALPPQPLPAGGRRGDPADAAPEPPADAGGEPEVIAVVSSTGGVWVLGAMLRDVPARGRAVLVAQHMDADFVPFFTQWLAGASGWPTTLVDGQAPLTPGIVYVPAGGCDLILDGEVVRTASSLSRFVPSGDRLLASAAQLGARTVGVVLSGMGSDGAEGLAEILRRGGRAVCQAPATAVVPSMPESALRRAPGAVAVPPDALAAVVGASRDDRAR
jgi:chemotaxis response regulator CheB